MSQYLITGGAGFIGYNFIRYALQKYPESSFVCLDALTYASNQEEIYRLSHPNFTFIQGNICNTEQINTLFCKNHFDYVIHFAAETHVDRSIADSAVFLQTNVLGVQVLLEACRRFGVKRFHQISTDEVYGDLSLDDSSSCDEYANLKPSNPYSASKAAADLLVLSYYKTYGLPVTISRCTNNYGPYQHAEKFIPTVIRCALKNQPVPIYGTGKNIRDWLYVDDHCRAVDLIVHNGLAGQIYNIARGEGLSNRVVAEAILQRLNRPKSLITYVDDRLGHDLKYSIQCHKIHRELGWSPQISFAEGIEKTIAFYKHQE